MNWPALIKAIGATLGIIVLGSAFCVAAIIIIIGNPMRFAIAALSIVVLVFGGRLCADFYDHFKR